MDAGRLNRKVVIERRVTGQDALGQPSTTWETVATVWADIRILGGLETLKAGADTSIVKASIRVRWKTGIDAGMRVKHGADLYDIKSVQPDVSRRMHIDLVCERVA